MNLSDYVVEHDRAAVIATVELVRQASPDDWTRPTPCAGWDLADLVAHMTAGHRGFAVAAAGGGTDLAPWQPVPTADPIGGYVAAADQVIASFAAPGLLEREMMVPVISTTIRFPAPVAIGFHYLDYLVHAWDVARTLDVPLSIPDDVIEPVLQLAREVPDDERRRKPGAFFQPSLEHTGGSTLDQILTLLGRSPGWKPA